MSFFPEVAKNTFSQGLGRLGVILTTIVITAFLTRLLGVSGYGDYVFLMALVMFFVTIADWGSGLIAVREASKDTRIEARFYANAFLLRFFLSLSAFFLLNLLGFFWPTLHSLSSPVKIASFLLLLISLKTSTHIIFQTKLKFGYLALSDVVVSLSFLGFLFFAFGFFLFSPSLSVILICFLFANFIGTSVAFFWANKLSRLEFRMDGEIFKKIIFESLPTGALLLVFSVYNRLDIFILQAIKGAGPVGLYGLAYKVHDNLILGAAYLTASLYPIFSKLASQNNKTQLLKPIYQKTFALLFLAGLTIILVIFLFAPWIIFVIGGKGFEGSILALRILVLATFFAYFNHLTGYTLIALGKQRISLIVAGLALFFNLSLNLIFIPRYSYLAAAVITIITEGLVLFITGFYLAKKFSLYPSLNFPKTLIELIKTRGKIF